MGRIRSCPALRCAAAAALFSVASAARADAGSPMMWASWFQLLGLNILIGILEGALLWKVYHAEAARAIRLMIAANYASFAVGLLLNPLGSWLLARPWMPPPLFAGRWIFVSLLAVSFALSVVVEWPFCWWAIGPCEDRRRRSWRASLLAQTVSYAVLVPFYSVFGSVGLYRSARIRPVATFAKAPATVYYLHPADGSLWRIRTDGTGRRKVMDARITGEGTGLSLRRSPGGRTADLWCVDEGLRVSEHPERPLLKGVAPASALPADNQLGSVGGRASGADGTYYWFEFGGPNDYRPKGQRPWTVSAEGSQWPYNEGLAVWVPRRRVQRLSATEWRETAGDTLFDLSFHTPFATFAARYATVLPNGQVVFESAGQVLLLDPPSRKLGVVTMGRSPIAIP